MKPKSLGTILPTKESDIVSDYYYVSNQNRINSKIKQLNLDRFPMKIVGDEKQFFINEDTYCIVSARDYSVLFFERRDSNPEHFFSVKPGSPNYKKLLEIAKNPLASSPK